MDNFSICHLQVCIQLFNLIVVWQITCIFQHWFLSAITEAERSQRLISEGLTVPLRCNLHVSHLLVPTSSLSQTVMSATLEMSFFHINFSLSGSVNVIPSIHRGFIWDPELFQAFLSHTSSTAWASKFLTLFKRSDSVLSGTFSTRVHFQCHLSCRIFSNS